MSSNRKAATEGQVVIVDDELASTQDASSGPGRLRQILGRVVASAGYRPIWVGSEAEAFKAIWNPRTVFCFLDMDLKAGGSGVNVFNRMVTEAKKSSQWVPLLTLTKFSPTIPDGDLEILEGQAGREKFPDKRGLVKRYRSRLYDWVEKYDMLTGDCSEEFLFNTIVSWARHPNNEDKKLILTPGTGSEPTTVDIVECDRRGKSGKSILTRAHPISSTVDWRSLISWPEDEDAASFEAVLVKLLCGIAADGEPVSVRALFGAENIPSKFTRSISVFNQKMRLLARGNLTPDLLRSVGGRMWDLKISHVEVIGDGQFYKPQEHVPVDLGDSQLAALRREFENHKKSHELIVKDLRARVVLLEENLKLKANPEAGIEPGLSVPRKGVGRKG